MSVIEWSIFGVTMALILWDVFLAADRSKSTISQVITRASKKWALIPYSWGVLAGHWFLPSPFDVPAWLTMGSLIAVFIGGIVLGHRNIRINRALAAAIGVVHGALLWGSV